MTRTVFLRDAALFAVLVAMFIVFSLTVDGFFDWFNILDRARYWVVPGIIAIPMTYIIATSGIDLSVGSIVALSHRRFRPSVPARSTTPRQNAPPRS